jgi:hypothetical protein
MKCVHACERNLTLVKLLTKASPNTMKGTSWATKYVWSFLMVVGVPLGVPMILVLAFDVVKLVIGPGK